MKQIGAWAFDVFMRDDGRIETHWEVSEYTGTIEDNEYGITDGPLWDALADACDAMNILYPLVPDPDLVTMSGLDKEEA